MTHLFAKNENDTDRVLRVAGGLTLLVATFVTGGFLKVLLGISSIALLVTGITGFCGIYKLLGISTCPVDKKKSRKKK
jgi:uncharacterized membrane protein YuzA (DUF378 family)